MSPRKKLGELLLSEGLIDEIQLRSAIGHQKNWGGKLGSTLVELGFLKETDIAKVLEEQLKQRCLNLGDLRPDTEAMKLITMQDALKYDVFPIRLSGSELTLAMANPYDLTIIDELSFKLGKKIKGVLAVESAIKKSIVTHYSGSGAGREYKVDVNLKNSGAPPVIVHMEHGRETVVSAAPPETNKVTPSPDLIAKALAYVLIDKGIITRDELIEKMKALKDRGEG